MVAAHASQREQILESALRTTRWPTKHNVAEATDDLGVHQQHHVPSLTTFRTLEQKPTTAISEQTEKATLQVRRKFVSLLFNWLHHIDILPFLSYLYF